MPYTAPTPLVDLRDLRLDTAISLVGHDESAHTAPANPTPAQYLQRLIDGLCDLSLKDPLTGLANRRHFQSVLEREIDRVTRSGEAALLLMLDIDRFKQVNDTYGHPAGDRVIKSLARLLKQRLRETDMVGRYGGEEFAVILSNTDGRTAVRVLDDIRKDFSRLHHLADSKEFSVTFSCGVADVSCFGDATKLCDAADKALYRAKHAGRNRVMPADTPTASGADFS